MILSVPGARNLTTSASQLLEYLTSHGVLISATNQYCGEIVLVKANNLVMRVDRTSDQVHSQLEWACAASTFRTAVQKISMGQTRSSTAVTSATSLDQLSSNEQLLCLLISVSDRLHLLSQLLAWQRKSASSAHLDHTSGPISANHEIVEAATAASACAALIKASVSRAVSVLHHSIR